MKSILVLCTGNSCRSQMAEAYFRHYLSSDFVVYSAGIEAHGLNPYAVKIMQEDGIDISDHSSDLIDDMDKTYFDYVLTVCDHARENCPYFPGKNIMHHDFPDPAKAKGSEEEIMTAFRKVRNQIKTYVAELAMEISEN